jgi:coatomer subunit gamma
MSYGKKDEDADIGLVKVDRTQVFQEGELHSARSTKREGPFS